MRILLKTASALILLSMCVRSIIAYGANQGTDSQPGITWTAEQIATAVAPMRAGRTLTPRAWPNDAKVAVCLSWDVDDESFELSNGQTEPVELSWAEYGAKEGLDRILQLYDKYHIVGSFYIPAVTALLHPEIVEKLKKRPQHEVGIHGWIHENVTKIDDREKERELLHKAITFWETALGKRPVGYRAPYWTFSKYTVQLMQEAGFEYDSSAMSMSEPYEINSYDHPTGLVEVPVSWALDDGAYLLPGWTTPSPITAPDLVFKLYRDDFDRAYDEGTVFVLTMHPMITGRRSYMPYLEQLIVYMRSKPGVWFATAQQIAEHVAPRRPLTR